MLWLWSGFLVLILLLLALDLGVFHKRPHAIGAVEALLWTVFWIALSLVFNVFIYFLYEGHWLTAGTGPHAAPDGHTAALQYLTGFLIEKSLSMDNIFVIALIFSYFRVDRKYQHRVLFWGIMGALVLRGVMILAGAALVSRFEWIIYVFGGLLVLTALRMLLHKEEEVHPEKNLVIRAARRIWPVAPTFEEQRFVSAHKINGQRALTPLAIVLLMIESTDVLFAIDSIPAIFAITFDPFIVFTSNVFAILGLRSLYFALAAMLDRFKLLRFSLIFILFFVGGKMLLAEVFHMPTWVSLVVVAVSVTLGIVASMLITKREAVPANPHK